MDEWIPPFIRDNRFFMFPFFFIWYKGRNIQKHMNFKKIVYDMTPIEMEDFYRNRESLATERETDLSKLSIRHMIERIQPDSKSLIDVGCGNGFFLSEVSNKKLECHGCDLQNRIRTPGINFHYGNVEKLPFPDKSFDIVTCHHTLEHIIDLGKAISELKRITKKQLMIVVPCQRPYFYTLDEHVHFFPHKSFLVNIIGLKNYSCIKIFGDWVYIGKIESSK